MEELVSLLRVYRRKKDLRDPKMPLQEGKRNEKSALAGLGAVSYTHLDVYKRQLLHGGEKRKTGTFRAAFSGQHRGGDSAVFLPVPRH